MTFRQGLSPVDAGADRARPREKIKCPGQWAVRPARPQRVGQVLGAGAKVRIAGTSVLAVTDAQGRFPAWKGALMGNVPIEVSAENFTTEKFVAQAGGEPGSRGSAWCSARG